MHCFLSSMLLRYAFSRLRSTQVAVVHCSAQTSSRHVLQKLGQTCLLLSSNTGRVFRPKDCENLVLYLKDINLPKPDKWGTSNLTAFLQQVKRIHKQKDLQISKQISEWMIWLRKFTLINALLSLNSPIFSILNSLTLFFSSLFIYFVFPPGFDI